MPVNTGDLLSTGGNFLIDFFANNKRQGDSAAALSALQNSPVLSELRSLRGLMGSQATRDFSRLGSFNLDDRSNAIKQDLFNIVRPDLESLGAQTVSNDFQRGTLGLDIGGRGSPLQRAFAKNLGTEISRANVEGRNQALNENITLATLFNNDIDAIRRLAEPDIDLQKSILENSLGKSQSDSSLLTGGAKGLLDLVGKFFGSGPSTGGVGALGGLTSDAVNAAGGLTNIFGDMFGGALGSFGLGDTLPGFSFGADALGAGDLSSLGGIFADFGGGGTSLGAGVTPSPSTLTSILDTLGLGGGSTGSSGTSLTGSIGNSLSNFLGGQGTVSQGLSSLLAGNGTAFAASPAFGALMGLGGPALIGALIGGLGQSPGGVINPVTGRAAMNGDPIPSVDSQGNLTSTPMSSISGFVDSNGLFHMQDPGRGAMKITIQNPKIGANKVPQNVPGGQVWIPDALLASTSALGPDIGVGAPSPTQVLSPNVNINQLLSAPRDSLTAADRLRLLMHFEPGGG